MAYGLTETRLTFIACGVSWFGSLLSMLAVGYMDAEALGQPSVSGGIYIHDHKVKGVVRFVTDEQYRILVLLAWMSVASWTLILISWPLFHWLTLRQRQGRRIP
jgi:hypothetical protein